MVGQPSDLVAVLEEDRSDFPVLVLDVPSDLPAFVRAPGGPAPQERGRPGPLRARRRPRRRGPGHLARRARSPAVGARPGEPPVRADRILELLDRGEPVVSVAGLPSRPSCSWPSASRARSDPPTGATTSLINHRCRPATATAAGGYYGDPSMQVRSTRFGTFEVDESRALVFAQGLLGFPDSSTYVVIEVEDTPYVWLQSVDEEEVAFLATSPFLFFPAYDLELGDEEQKRLDVDDPGAGRGAGPPDGPPGRGAAREHHRQPPRTRSWSTPSLGGRCNWSSTTRTTRPGSRWWPDARAVPP